MKAQELLEEWIVWGGLPIQRGDAIREMQEMGIAEWVIGSTLDRCPVITAN